MSIIGTVTFCTDCGNLLERAPGSAKQVCELCNAVTGLPPFPPPLEGQKKSNRRALTSTQTRHRRAALQRRRTPPPSQVHCASAAPQCRRLQPRTSTPRPPSRSHAPPVAGPRCGFAPCSCVARTRAPQSSIAASAATGLIPTTRGGVSGS